MALFSNARVCVWKAGTRGVIHRGGGLFVAVGECCGWMFWRNLEEIFFLWINTDTIKEVYFLSADWIIKKFHNILTFDVQLKKKTNALKHFFK